MYEHFGATSMIGFGCRSLTQTLPFINIDEWWMKKNVLRCFIYYLICCKIFIINYYAKYMNKSFTFPKWPIIYVHSYGWEYVRVFASAIILHTVQVNYVTKHIFLHRILEYCTYIITIPIPFLFLANKYI